MPSFEVAAEERPVTVSGEQPPRSLARRKSTPETPPPPSRPAPQNVLVNEATQIPRPKPEAAPSPFAAGRRGPKPASVLGAGLGEKEAQRIKEELGETPAPGLNGDHATRAAERAKIPPSRPANNCRGDEGVRKVGEFTFYRGEPPPRRLGAPTSPLGQAIRELQPGEFMTIAPDAKTHGLVRSILHNLREKKICPGLQTYLSADRSARVVMRKADGGQESEAAR